MSISARTVCNRSSDGYNLAHTVKEGDLTDRVTVDTELCIGHGECVRIAPLAFALDDEATISHPLPAAASVPLDLLVDAAWNCPTNAIEVRAEDGTVLVASA